MLRDEGGEGRKCEAIDLRRGRARVDRKIARVKMRSETKIRRTGFEFLCWDNLLLVLLVPVLPLIPRYC